MKVRAKFICDDKEDTGEGFNLIMSAVVDGSAENEQFFKFTPGGSLTLYTVNPAVAEAIEPGKEYYIDITLAE
jgi:hypothetical protein